MTIIFFPIVLLFFQVFINPNNFFKIMTKFLIFFLSAFIFQTFAQNTSIYISNSGICTFCNGSLEDPYNDIYKAFLQSPIQYSTSQFLIFKINPTSTPYYIFELNVTNVSPFQNFLGFFFFWKISTII